MQEIKVVHCKKDKFDIYIGRSAAAKSLSWGNPFAISEKMNRQEVIDRFEDFLLRNPALFAEALRVMPGKVLGCFCSPLACHGDIYKKYVENPRLYKEKRIEMGLEQAASEVSQQNPTTPTTKEGVHNSLNKKAFTFNYLKIK